MKINLTFLLAIYFYTIGFAQNQTTFADDLKYSGIAVEEPGYVVWGASPIAGSDGKTHLFVGRWPGTKVKPGWCTQSEIAHYTF